MAGRHWTQVIADELKSELEKASAAARNVFSDLRTPRPKPTRRQRLLRFLTMPREERLRLAADMGPEDWGKFIDRNMSDLVEVVGPMGRVLLPYLYADSVPSQSPEASAARLEADLMALLEGGEDELAVTEFEDELVEE